MFLSIVCYIKYSSDVRDVYKTENREQSMKREDREQMW